MIRRDGHGLSSSLTGPVIFLSTHYRGSSVGRGRSRSEMGKSYLDSIALSLPVPIS